MIPLSSMVKLYLNLNLFIKYFFQTFRSVAYIFEYVKAVYGEDSISDSAFYDLGSGIGRGVIAGSFLHPFKKCIGIEYLEKLSNIGQEIKEKYDLKKEEMFK